ncbi:MAG: HEPN domain-containing protein [Thermoplasmataceae archaeon]
MRPNILLKLSSEFTSLVSKTADNDLREGLIRASIEKSYYYVFLVIREALTAIGIQISITSKAHSEVIEQLKKLCESKNATVYDRKLRSLRDQRNRATYDLSAKIDKTEADSATIEISKLLNDLSMDRNLGAEILNNK